VGRSEGNDISNFCIPDVSFLEVIHCDKERTTMATVSKVVEFLGVDRDKVKRWTKEFAEYSIRSMANAKLLLLVVLSS
jgi:hypothetical protein